MDPSSVSGEIGIGVVSGILSAGLLAFVSYLWFYVLSPALDNRLYRGILVDGKWEGVEKGFVRDDEKSKLEMLIELKQSGYKISGIFRARVSYSYSEETYENLYEVKGKIRDNYVLIEYGALSRKRTGLGTFVLKITDGGKSLSGSISFIEEGNMDVSSLSEVELKRIVD